MGLRSILDKLRFDLVDRRLLPIPIVLIAGLIALPLLATKGRSTASALPFVTPTTSSSTTTTAKRPSVKRNHGDSTGEVDPFATAAAATPGADQTTTNQNKTTGSQTPNSTSTVNATVPSTTSTPSTTPSSTVVQGSSADEFVIRAVDLRMGGDIVPRIRRDVPRLSPLPSNHAPAALLLGILPGAKAVVFRLSPGVTVAGSGICVPRVTICAQLVLRVGERALLTRPSGRRLRLELVRLRATRTHDKARARRAYDRYSRSGQCILDTVSAYTFDPDSGVLHRSGAVESCRYAAPDASGSLRGASVKRTPKVKKSTDHAE